MAISYLRLEVLRTCNQPIKAIIANRYLFVNDFLRILKVNPLLTMFMFTLVPVDNYIGYSL